MLTQISAPPDIVSSMMVLDMDHADDVGACLIRCKCLSWSDLVKSEAPVIQVDERLRYVMKEK